MFNVVNFVKEEVFFLSTVGNEISDAKASLIFQQSSPKMKSCLAPFLLNEKPNRGLFGKGEEVVNDCVRTLVIVTLKK